MMMAKLEGKSRFEDHLFAGLGLLQVRTSPFNSKDAGLQEFLVCVLATDIKPVYAELIELFHDEIVPREKMLLREPTVEDKCVALENICKSREVNASRRVRCQEPQRSVAVVSDVTHPVITQHLTRCVHPNRANHTGLYAKKSMVKQGHLDKILAQSSCLNIIVICLADAPHPAVRGAVVGDLEFQSLEHDSLSLEDFIFCIAILSHEDKLIH